VKKRLIARSLIGFVAGALIVHVMTLLANYFSCGQYLVCVPQLTEKFGHTRAVVIQTVLGALVGMIALGGTCLFDIEKWSLLCASTVHCALIFITDMIVGLLLCWFSFKIKPILIMACIVVLIYALIWFVMYVIWKREIRQMNHLAEEYIKGNDTHNRLLYK
jgi:MFS family permease